MADIDKIILPNGTECNLGGGETEKILQQTTNDLYTELTGDEEEWVSGGSYTEGQIVKYNNLHYECLLTGTTQTPGYGVSDWTQVTKVGISENNIFKWKSGKTYSLGQLVYHKGFIFENKAVPGNIEPGTDENVWSLPYINDLITYVKMLNKIYPYKSNFSTTTQYYRNMIIIRDGRLYKCTTNHKGNWSQSHFSRIDVKGINYNKFCSAWLDDSIGAVSWGPDENASAKTIRHYLGNPIYFATAYTAGTSTIGTNGVTISTEEHFIKYLAGTL